MRIHANFSATRQTRWTEYGVRFAFGAAVTGFAGMLGKECGPALAGLFLAFPAIFPATATLIEKHEKEKKRRAGFDGTSRGRRAAGMDAAGAVLGSVGLVVFAVVAWKLTALLAAWEMLLIATALWFGVGYLLWLLRKSHFRFLRRRD